MQKETPENLLPYHPPCPIVPASLSLLLSVCLDVGHIINNVHRGSHRESVSTLSSWKQKSVLSIFHLIFTIIVWRSSIHISILHRRKLNHREVKQPKTTQPGFKPKSLSPEWAPQSAHKNSAPVIHFHEEAPYWSQLVSPHRAGLSTTLQ